MQAQPISVHSGTPEVAALLLSLFATDELTVFLHEPPDGPTFAAKLPSGSASAHQRAWNTV